MSKMGNIFYLYNDLKKRHQNCQVIIDQLEKENSNLSVENFYLKGEVKRLNDKVTSGENNEKEKQD